MTTRTSLPLKHLTVFVALLGLLIGGCDAFQGVSAEPLTLTSEGSEPGWSRATGGGVSADCPSSWTLEVTNRATRAWRCAHPAAHESPGGCGLTVYGAKGAKNLDELIKHMQPEIEAYSDESELLSSDRSTLGSQEAQSFVLDQIVDEHKVRGWYRLALVDDTGWLAHCILPEEYIESDEEQVQEILDRIQL